MQPEPGACSHQDSGLIDRLAASLYQLAGEQDVRVIEALAAVFVNRRRQGLREPQCGLAEPAASWRFDGAQDEADAAARLAICRRIARRALRGSLADPTGGATASHRIEASPTWSRDLLPIGVFGPFLFYRLATARQEARIWSGIERFEHHREPTGDAGSAR